MSEKKPNEKTFDFDAPIPADKVRQREGSNGMTLDYLEGWYVISQLNEAFGNGRWGYVVDRLDYHGPREVTTKYGPRTQVGATCVVRMHVPSQDGREVVIGDVGFGTGIDKDEMAARESASKEAATDALKRAAKSLGWRFGLALYDKSREHVVSEEDTARNEAKGLIAAELKRLLPDATDKERSAAYKMVAANIGGGPLDALEWLKAAKSLDVPVSPDSTEAAT